MTAPRIPRVSRRQPDTILDSDLEAWRRADACMEQLGHQAHAWWLGVLCGFLAGTATSASFFLFAFL